MANYTVQCHRCQKDFQTTKYKATRNKHHYCSRDCFYNFAAIECDYCGKDVIKQGFSIDKYTKHFCNNDCHRSYMAENKLSIQRKCEQCGKTFHARSKPTENAPFKYCSRHCHNKSMDTRHEKECPVCHKIFMAKPCKEKLGFDTYCSRVCKIKGKEPTTIELTIARMLTDLKIDYVEQYSIGRYVVDYLIPSQKLIIECDGSYWHSIPKVKKRDSLKDEYFTHRNFRVLRLPETDIKNNLAWCKEQIKLCLQREPASNDTQCAPEVLRSDYLPYVQAALEFA